MALENLSGGVEGLLGGLKSGLDLQETAADAERKRKLAALQALLHSQALLEENPEAASGLEGIIPEPTLSNLKNFAQRSQEATTQFLSKATGGAITPDIAGRLKKFESIIAPFVKRQVDLQEKERIGNLINKTNVGITAHQQANPNATRFESARAVIANMSPEDQPQAAALLYEKPDLFGQGPSFKEEQQGNLGRLLQSAVVAVDKGFPADQAVKMITPAFVTAGTFPSLDNLEPFFPTVVAEIRKRKALADAFGNVQGKAAAEITPVSPGGPTPQTIEATSEQKKTTSRILGEYEALSKSVDNPLGNVVGEVLRQFKREPNLSNLVVDELNKAESAGTLTPGQKFKTAVDIMSRLDPLKQVFQGVLKDKGLTVGPNDVENAANAIDQASQTRGLPKRTTPTTSQLLPSKGEGARQQSERSMPGRNTIVNSAAEARDKLNNAITAGNTEQADAIALNIARAGVRRGITADQMIQGISGLPANQQDVLRRAIERVQKETP